MVRIKFDTTPASDLNVPGWFGDPQREEERGEVHKRRAWYDDDDDAPSEYMIHEYMMKRENPVLSTAPSRFGENRVGAAVMATCGFGSKAGFYAAPRRVVPLENSYPVPAWQGWRQKRKTSQGTILSVLLSCIVYMFLITSFASGPAYKLLVFMILALFIGLGYFLGDLYYAALGHGQTDTRKSQEKERVVVLHNAFL